MNFARTLALLPIILLLLMGGCAETPVEPVDLTGSAAGTTAAKIHEDLIVREGTLPSGALYRIALDKETFNGGAIFYAHGYKSVYEPVAVPNDAVGETTLEEIVISLGYAYATTSYRANGLVADKAVDDIAELHDVYAQEFGELGDIFLAGASEGGLVTALTLERYPGLFDGGLATCGPIGDFQRQLEYIGDFRLVFDYFFPGVIPGDPFDIPEEVVSNWFTTYVPAISNAMAAEPVKTLQLLMVTKPPINYFNKELVNETVQELLWYNAFASRDASAVLGGLPYDNTEKVYSGSFNNDALNAGIARFEADPAALQQVEERFETAGRPEGVIVTMHTTGDYLIPYWHEYDYRRKTRGNGTGWNHINIPVFRYGHCSFEVQHVVAGFAVLALKHTLNQLKVPEDLFAYESQRREFLSLARENGAKPEMVQRQEMRLYKMNIQ